MPIHTIHGIHTIHSIREYYACMHVGQETGPRPHPHRQRATAQ